ncbi:hypothetical protein BC777_2742 [Yoonia maricola]|uniref:Uncharacterized protein n=1 Tax=Yoonia maricola TaxID=420999 RepID=A0A2M8W617_9RHOB|nr:hypothetical protein BC777_2742 [Yoonia maricola]
MGQTTLKQSAPGSACAIHSKRTRSSVMRSSAAKSDRMTPVLYLAQATLLFFCKNSQDQRRKARAVAFDEHRQRLQKVITHIKHKILAALAALVPTISAVFAEPVPTHSLTCSTIPRVALHIARVQGAAAYPGGGLQGHTEFTRETHTGVSWVMKANGPGSKRPARFMHLQPDQQILSCMKSSNDTVTMNAWS